MGDLSKDLVVTQILGVLEEACLAPEKPWSYFNDQGAESSLCGIVDRLRADEAVREMHGVSVASVVGHVAFGMRASAAFLRGERVRSNWAASWEKRDLDAAGWAEMIADLQSAYGELNQAIREHAADSGDTLGAAMGAVAHIAYHLGEIRQISGALLEAG